MNIRPNRRLPGPTMAVVASALLPLSLMLGACRTDDAPAPQTLAPGTTVTTTTRTVTTAAPLAQQPAPQATAIVQAPMDAVEPPQPAVVQQPAPVRAPVAAPARRVVADAEPVRRSDSRGRIVGIEPVVEKDSPSGAGAAVGGLLGGVLGNQVGGGTGRTAATVLGAVGGAVVGNHVEKNRSSHITGYRVSVRTDAGNVREFQRRDINDLNVGAPVRIVNGGVQPA